MKQIIQTALLRSSLIACLAAGCTTDDELPPEPPVDQVALNRDLLHRYHVEVWEEGRLDRAGEYLAPTFTSHARVTTLPPGAVIGPDFLAQFWIGFPDLHSREDAVLADGDLVTVRWTITGTHTGPFFGVAATGKPIEVAGMDILRVADGKFVEHWGGVADQMDDFLAQIEAPAP